MFTNRFRKVRVKKVECKRLDKNKKAYLIFRYYPDLKLNEYIVCINYQFKSNTFDEGLIIERLDESYKYFNLLCNVGSFADLLKNKAGVTND